jgi:hypothetical protein
VFSDLLEIDAVLVGEWVEDVHLFNCVLAALFVAVDQVDPMVDVLRNVPVLQLFPEFSHEVEGIVVGPPGEDSVVHFHLVLCQSVEVVVLVDEHLGQRIDLGDEFPDVGRAGSCVFPRSAIAMEDAVCAVESSALES